MAEAPQQYSISGIPVEATENNAGDLYEASRDNGDGTYSTVKKKHSSLVSGLATESALAAHATDTDNPHQTTKAQVGLDQVANVDTRQRSNHTGTQAMSTVSGLSAALAAKADADATPTELTDLDTTVTGPQLNALKTKLDGVAEGATANSSDATLLNRANHTGTQPASTISDFATATDARIAAQKGQASGIASLDSGGKVPTNQLPALALTDVYTVASQSAQLALSAQEGDVAIRSDQNKSYIHNGGTSGTMADWNELLTPTDQVLSVAGKTGAVTLSKSDVGLSNVPNTDATNRANHTGTQAINTISGLQSALDGKAPLTHNHDDRYFTESETSALLSDKADDDAVVHTTGNETVAGIKTFSSSPVVPTPTTDMQAASKKYVDDELAALPGGGDMAKTTYDPNNVSGDAFAMDNMAEGATNKILTAPERAAIASAVQPEDLAAVATTGAYSDLSGKPSIPNKTSDLSNDSGFLTSHQDISGKVDKTTTVNGHALSANITVSKSDVGLGNVTNDAQVKATDIDTDSTFAANSTTKVPSQSAVKTALSAKADTASLGTAASADTGDFATASQGAKADSAVQPGDLGAVATSNDYNDLDNKPSIPTLPSTIVESIVAGTNITVDDTDPANPIVSASGGGGGGASSLNDLTDVTISSPNDTEALLYESDTGKFINRKINLGDHSDIGFVDPDTNHYPYYDSSISKWRNRILNLENAVAGGDTLTGNTKKLKIQYETGESTQMTHQKFSATAESGDKTDLSGESLDFTKGSYAASVATDTLTAKRTHTLPDKTGTLAHTSDIPEVIDEDDMASDSATKVPTQQSVKAYVDANAGGGGGGGSSIANLLIADLTNTSPANGGSTSGSGQNGYSVGARRITSSGSPGNRQGLMLYGGVQDSLVGFPAPVKPYFVFKGFIIHSGGMYGTAVMRLMVQNAPGSYNSHTAPGNNVGLLFSVGGNVFNIVSNGSAATTTTSGVNSISNHQDWVVLLNSSGDWEFYHQGVLKNTLTTNKPTLAAGYGYFGYYTSANTDSSAAGMGIETLYMGEQ